MNAARESKRWLAAMMASSIAVVDVQAAVTDIFNQPLGATTTVVAKPNIMFILDNSGSMQRDFMPDELGDGDSGYTGKYGYWSPQCNGVAFDPSNPYDPPVKPDGTTYPQVSFTAAMREGFAGWGTGTLRNSDTSRAIGTGGKTFTLDSGGGTSYLVGQEVTVAYRQDGSNRMIGTVTAWDSTNRVLTLNVTSTMGSGTYNEWYVSRMLTLDGSTYYSYNTPGQTAMSWTYTTSGVTANTFYNECMSNIGSTPGSSKFTLQTVTTASSATVQQKYANWYAYYRTRRLMMRTAAGKAFKDLDDKFRVGFTTISDTTAKDGDNRFVDVADYGTTQKQKFYKSLYTADGDGYTPLRASLAKVGRYFAGKAPGQVAASDPMQYSCQRNYAILSTDGYWNTNAESSTYGAFVANADTDIGQRDGTEARPMRDSQVNTKTIKTTVIETQRESVVKTYRSSATYRRYRWQIGNTSSSCGITGQGTRRDVTIREQQRTETADTAVTEVRDATRTRVYTVVWTDDVKTSDNTSTGGVVSAPSYTTVSTSAAVPTGSNTGSFGNVGSNVAGCATAQGMDDFTPPLVANSTVYSTTSDTTCYNGACNYTFTDPASGVGGTVISTTPSSLQSTGAPTPIGSMSSSAPVDAETVTSSGGVNTTLADVAQYYYATDLRSAALNNCTSGSSGNDVCSNNTLSPMPPRDVATHQHMTTYTIGLGLNGTLPYVQDYLDQATGTYADLTSGAVKWPNPMTTEGATRIDDLWHAAVNGRGRYFATKNANTLANALVDALSAAKTSVGSAAGAATNSLQPVAGDNNLAYIATYATVEWSGDVTAYPLDAATGFVNKAAGATWSAKKQLDLVLASNRKIYYKKPGAATLQALTNANVTTDGLVSNFSGFCSKTPAPAQCGTLTALDTAAGNTNLITAANNSDNLIKYLRGDPANETVTNPTNPLYRERTGKLGDIINASPAYVKKSPLEYGDVGHGSFVSGGASRRGMLYAAANDGMLHAFDATTGDELWAYVPTFVMPNLYKLADTNFRNQHSYFVDGTPIVGDIYTGSVWKTILVGGLNSGGKGYYALDITDPNNPAVLWEFTHSTMGLTYGNPVITKNAAGTWIVVVSSGLNNADGLGRLYQINATTGALMTGSPISTGAGDAATPSGLAKINAWIDSSTNNTAKRFYGGDMLGNLWRFDFDNLVPPTGSEAIKLAQFQINPTTPQPITTKPQLTVVTASGGTKVPVVSVATGRFLGTSDVDDTTVQSIYAIKEPLTDTGWGDVRARADLVVQTVTTTTTTGTGSNNAVDWTTKIGWRLDLPHSKERVVTDHLLQFNVLTVATAIPVPSASECKNSGESWIYEINIGTGTAANGSTIASFLGNFLVVGMSSILASDGTMRQIIVGDDTNVRTRTPASPTFPSGNVRRSAWRELIN